MEKPPSAGCVFLMGLVAAGIIGALDWIFVPAFVEQFRSADWPAVQGRVIESRLESGDESGTWSPYVHYRYTVDGVTHDSDRITVASEARSGEDWASDIRARFPAGATVTVYYDPSAPDRAVLLRGGQGSQAWGILLMLLFNGALVGGWLFGLRQWGRSRTARRLTTSVGTPGFDPPVPFSCSLLEDGKIVRLRVPDLNARGAAVLALGVCTFLGVFLSAGIGCLGAPVWLALALPALPAVVIPVIVWRYRMRGVGRGGHDLVIDRSAGLIHPPSAGVEPSPDAVIAELNRISVRTDYVDRGKGAEPRGWWEYAVVAEWGEAKGRRTNTQLAKFSNDKPRALSLAVWLAHRLECELVVDEADSLGTA